MCVFLYANTCINKVKSVIGRYCYRDAVILMDSELFFTERESFPCGHNSYRASTGMSTGAGD